MGEFIPQKFLCDFLRVAECLETLDQTCQNGFFERSLKWTFSDFKLVIVKVEWESSRDVSSVKKNVAERERGRFS